jgi:hypothetical protein
VSLPAALVRRFCRSQARPYPRVSAKSIKFLPERPVYPKTSLRKPFEKPQLEFNTLPSLKPARVSQLSRPAQDMLLKSRRCNRCGMPGLLNGNSPTHDHNDRSIEHSILFFRPTTRSSRRRAGKSMATPSDQAPSFLILATFPLGFFRDPVPRV